MNLEIQRVVVIELGQRQVVPVTHGKGVRIDCLRGRIWITDRACAGDVVLEAGESYDVSRGGDAVVQALGGALAALWTPAASAAGGRHTWMRFNPAEFLAAFRPRRTHVTADAG
jgi:hypothetical protein